MMVLFSSVSAGVFWSETFYETKYQGITFSEEYIPTDLGDPEWADTGELSISCMMQ